MHAPAVFTFVSSLILSRPYLHTPPRFAPPVPPAVQFVIKGPPLEHLFALSSDRDDPGYIRSIKSSILVLIVPVALTITEG